MIHDLKQYKVTIPVPENKLQPQIHLSFES